MTPKTKAISLIEQFGNIFIGETEDGNPYLLSSESLKEAKQSALICVDEMIFENNLHLNSFGRERIFFLKEVKKEIENA